MSVPQPAYRTTYTDVSTA